MARQEIILGTPPTGLGGDPPRVASMKINAMTLELFEKISKLGSAAFTNILGSMASGAIIERGSNANGEFTKWTDGTMICWVRFAGYTAGQRTGSWPANFTTFPCVSGSVQPSAALDYQWMTWGTPSTWGFWPASSFNNIVCIIAVGRWK